ncbi:hypothetical protein [Buttiauxella sp. WJP83]|uniref:hypothetical protein n=1 Tax=Buttiauxella sp. WJP83 TaxID=2986951 RepID=UPI003FA454B0
MLLVCVEVSGLKNRCNSQNLAHRSGAHLLLATCIPCIYPCRCYTHLGASQDSRAGHLTP